MRLHNPVHPDKQPHLTSGIPFPGTPGYAEGGEVSGLSNDVPDVSTLTGNAGGGEAEADQSAGAFSNNTPASPDTDYGVHTTPNVTPANHTTPNVTKGNHTVANHTTGNHTVGNHTAGNHTTPNITKGNQTKPNITTPQNIHESAAQQLGASMGQGALAKAAANWQALNPSWNEPSWLSSASGNSTQHLAEGGIVDSSNSANPLSRVIGMAQNKMKDISKPPAQIPNEGPTRAQGGPARDSYAEGGAVNSDDEGEVNPQSLLGGQPAQPQQAADNQAIPDTTDTLGGPTPSAGSQTVTGLVSSAKQTYQTIQQALQKAWTASKGTGQAAAGGPAVNQPGSQGQASGGGFAGNTAATGIPAQSTIGAQAPTGQAQSAPLQAPKPTGAGNPIQPGSYPVNTSNVAGIPGGGQPSAASAASPQGPLAPTPQQQQLSNQNG